MIYEYVCDICSQKQEIFAPMDHDLPRCDNCGIPMRRVFTPCAIRVTAIKAPSNAIEIGNEDPRAPQIQHSYDIDPAVLNQYPELSSCGD